MTRREVIKGHHIRTFDSFSDYLEFAKKDIKFNGTRSSRRTSDNGWSGSASFEDAVEIATKGWQEGRNMIEDFTSQILPSIMSHVPIKDIEYSYAGSNMIDMGRFMEGDPECFMVEHDTDHCSDQRTFNQKIIKIALNFATSCGYDAGVITRRGSALVALVDALEQCDYRVELWAVCCVTYSDSSYETRVKIKNPSDPLNIDNVAFALAHPSMLRRIWFAVLENEPDGENFGAGHAYGYPSSTSIRSDLCLDKMHYNDNKIFANPKTCIEWVLKKLEEFGAIVQEKVEAV